MMRPEPKPLTVRTLISELLKLPASANDLPIIADGCDCEGEALAVILRPLGGANQYIAGSVLIARYAVPKPLTPEELKTKAREDAKAARLQAQWTPGTPEHERAVEKAYGKHLAAMTPKERKMAERSARGLKKARGGR